MDPKLARRLSILTGAIGAATMCLAPMVRPEAMTEVLLIGLVSALTGAYGLAQAPEMPVEES